MDIRPLEPGFSTAPNLAKDELPGVAALGYRTVISNRFDDEDPGQPSAQEMSEAAAVAGLDFVHIPVSAMAIGDGEVAALRHALETMPGPILGYCRSGIRTTVLWALARAGHRSVDDIVQAAADAGYDLSPLRLQLETLA